MFKRHLSGLWAIVNNAGFNIMGDVEWLTVPLYHKAMNVNFYGAVRVMRAFLYLVRKARVKYIYSHKKYEAIDIRPHIFCRL